MRSVFIGIGGFLGRIDGETRCAFWGDEPVDHDFDPQRLITVDLARTPAAAATQEIRWDDVQVDDCLTGPNGNVNGTTLGPRWPELRLEGAVYLERGFDSYVAHFFQSLAHDQLLPRLEVVAVRLLGCETAVSPCGQRSLRLLASTPRIPVFGTLKPLMKSHYNRLGFNPAFAQILVEASELV